MTPDFDQDGEEARLRERANWLLDGLQHHADTASRRLAERMRGLLEGPLSSAKLQSVVAGLEAATGQARTLQQLTSNSLVRRSASSASSRRGRLTGNEEDCPEGFKNPDTGECIEERRGTRPMTEAESFAKMKLAADLDRLLSRKSNPTSPLHGIWSELALRRKALEDVILFAQLRPVPEPDGRVLLRQLDERLRKGRRSPLLESLDASLRRHPPSLLDQIDGVLAGGRR